MSQVEKKQVVPVFTAVGGGVLAAGGAAVLNPARGHAHADGIACACGAVHGDGSGHSHSGVGLNFQLTVLLPLTIAALVLAYALTWSGEQEAVAKALGLLAAALAGGPILWQAIKGLSRGQTNVNELVSISILGAIWLDMPLEAGLVALILQIGALIESVATETAQNAVLALQKLAPKHARVKHVGADGVGHDHVVEVESLKVGDVLVVGPGERLAADGKMVSGSTSVDESSVTGEAAPVDKGVGSEVLAGTINLTGSAEVMVERVGAKSALGQTIELVRRAQAYQPQVIRAADKFFALYTPIILILSVLVLIVTKDPRRMVTMWVVGCPCAMLLASPLAIVVALARASRSGIQVKAGPFVEASASLDTVVFDKTGTLTTGKFVVSAVKVAEGVTANELLTLAVTVESRSSHPLAKALVGYAKEVGVGPSEAADMKVLEGLGIEALVNGEMVRVGSLKILPEEMAGDVARLEEQGGAGDGKGGEDVAVYVVKGGRGGEGWKLMGVIYLTDEIRPEARKTVQRLRALAIKRVVMLTGDRRRTAEAVAQAVGCDEVFAELLPGQKAGIVRSLQRGGHGVAMVGDGINDGPSLAAATVGIAMGIRGTDVAVAAADAVLLKDDLTRVPLLIYLARQTRSAIYQNLGFAVVFTGAVELIVALGWLTVWMGKWAVVAAALAHVAGVVVIAVNSVRLAGR